MGGSSSRSSVLRDCGVLVLVVGLSVASYLGQLGFYSDDWGFLVRLSSQGEKHLLARIGEMSSGNARPVQVLLYIGLFEFFRFDPLGYHAINALVLALNAVLFYLCLLRLHVDRLIALSICIIYVLLPHYSTDRFWMAAFQVPLSMALYFLSLYCDLRAVTAAGRAQLYVWKTVSIAALLASAFAYETPLGLFLLNPLLAMYAAGGRRRAFSGRRRWESLFLYASNPVLVVGVMVYILAATLNRAKHVVEGPAAHLRRLARDLFTPFRLETEVGGFNIWQFLEVDLIDRGLKLPFLAIQALQRDYVDWLEVALAGAVALAVFGTVWTVARSRSGLLLRPRPWARLALAGIVVALAGYAVIAAIGHIQFTLAGIGNRVSMSAAPGLAVVFVGMIGWLAAGPGAVRRRRVAFASGVALLAASGTLVNQAIASFWVEAYDREQALLETIRDRFPTLPEGSTLMLDGMCPYHGPGIVFEASWDFRAALRLLYGDLTLRGDVVTPRLELTRDGLTTKIYGNVTSYRYGPRLIVFDVSTGRSARLADAAAARAWFAEEKAGAADACPPGSPGTGVPIFGPRERH